MGRERQITGTVIKGIGGFYYVYDGIQRIYECRARGIFRNRREKPLVGDRVVVDILDSQKGLGNLVGILERKNHLIRPAAANIDQALLMFSASYPAPNLDLLDRLLISMEERGVPCHICFTKEELIDGAEEERLRSIYKNSGVPVLFLSCYTGKGLEDIHLLLRGKTTVLAGPSGVGKSTLMNRIVPGAGMEIGEISGKIQKGRHTTRHSQLFYAGENTFLMDTPGFSSLDVDMVPAEQLKYYFSEFTPYEGSCRFLGCAHAREPGCKVKQAVAEGKICRKRYDSYCFLYQEIRNCKKYEKGSAK